MRTLRNRSVTVSQRRKEREKTATEYGAAREEKREKRKKSSVTGFITDSKNRAIPEGTRRAREVDLGLT